LQDSTIGIIGKIKKKALLKRACEQSEKLG
jgi:hypothetical protein